MRRDLRQGRALAEELFNNVAAPQAPSVLWLDDGIPQRRIIHTKLRRTKEINPRSGFF